MKIMELTKKQWTIIGVIVAVIAVWYFFLRKKKAESNYKMPFRGNYSVPSGPANPPLPPKDHSLQEQIDAKNMARLGYCVAKNLDRPMSFGAGGKVTGPRENVYGERVPSVKEWHAFMNCFRELKMG